MDPRFPARRPEVVASVRRIKRANLLEKSTLRDYLLLAYLANSPKQWDAMIRNGHRFSAIPVDVDKIRDALGIKQEHRVVVAPVFSAEWSKIKNDSVGIDFSDEALRRHVNPFRIRADLRNIPLPDGYADHVISFEPTPLHPGTATMMDALMTLYELSRIGKNVHIIQRTRNRTPVWTYPFIQQYLAGLGVNYRVIDLSEHTAINRPFKLADKIGVVSVSFNGKDVMDKKKIMSGDIRAVYDFLRTLSKKNTVDPHDVRTLLRRTSPAFRKAFTEEFVLKKRPGVRLKGRRP